MLAGLTREFALSADLHHQLQATLGPGYTVELELPGGGMSRVFVAHDTSLGRRVVVKMLAPELAASVSAERFRRETRLAASLQQANIVPVLSAGEMEGLPYYTMPFIDGESLRARLSSHGALAIREVVGILRDVARALAFAHQNGVVHRDIKPENILLSGTTAVVTDFGIAKALEAARLQPREPTLTQIGSAMGTPTYMAPEQVSADPKVDHRADIYSFGVVAYELLTGFPPFGGRTLQALFAAHLIERPLPVDSKRADTPGDLSMLVMRCLEKEPGLRPQSAAEILEALEVVNSAAGARADAALVEKPSIGVLPFANLSPDPADEYFADGLTDEIITDLSPLHGLRVIARASMMRFKGSGKDPVTIARELQVRYVLDGSVRRAGSSLRLTVRLIDAVDGTTLWSDKLGGSLEDVFAMQERVSRTIVDALQVRLSPREEEGLLARPIADLRAYECYLQARQLMWTFTVGSLDRALQLLTAAEARIGTNALLVATEGNVHLNYIETGQVDAAQQLAAAQRCAVELETLDPDSFAVHSLRGAVQWRRGEIREAIVSLSRARQLEPNNSDVLPLLAYAYILAGQVAAAKELAALAIELDPLTPIFQCMPGFCEIMAGRPEGGVKPYRRFVEMDPTNPIARVFLVWVLVQAGERIEAIAVADALAAQFSDTVLGRLGRAYAHALRGEREEGVAAMTPDVLRMSEHSEAFANQIAGVMTLLGETEAAIAALEDCVRLGQSNYPYLAQHAVVFAALRDHPRFQRLLEVVRARWERGGASATDRAIDSARQ